jgi:hypothetical protein
LSRPAIVLVIGLVAMFNYFTRVADGTGVEADYESGLPQFVYRGLTESVPRPGPEEWPPVDLSIDSLAVLADVHATWCRWRDYIVESDGPIPRETRRRLQAIARLSACDGSAGPVDESGSGAVAESAAGSGGPLTEFAEKLSRTPWLLSAADVEALRSTGLNDLSILHAIAVVAYQSAESRLRIGLSALSASGI